MIKFPPNIISSQYDDYAIKVSKTGEEIRIQDNRGITNKLKNFIEKFIYSGEWTYKTSNIVKVLNRSEAGNPEIKGWVENRIKKDRQSVYISNIFDPQVQKIDYIAHSTLSASTGSNELEIPTKPSSLLDNSNKTTFNEAPTPNRLQASQNNFDYEVTNYPLSQIELPQNPTYEFSKAFPSLKGDTLSDFLKALKEINGQILSNEIERHSSIQGNSSLDINKLDEKAEKLTKRKAGLIKMYNLKGGEKFTALLDPAIPLKKDTYFYADTAERPDLLKSNAPLSLEEPSTDPKRAKMAPGFTVKTLNEIGVYKIPNFMSEGYDILEITKEEIEEGYQRMGLYFPIIETSRENYLLYNASNFSFP